MHKQIWRFLPPLTEKLYHLRTNLSSEPLKFFVICSRIGPKLDKLRNFLSLSIITTKYVTFSLTGIPFISVRLESLRGNKTDLFKLIFNPDTAEKIIQKRVAREREQLYRSVFICWAIKGDNTVDGQNYRESNHPAINN